MLVAETQEQEAPMVLLIVTCVAGIFFGLYYNFQVLIPLTSAAAIACCSAALLDGQTVPASLFSVVLPAVGLQGGYMIGLTSRDLLSQLLSRVNSINSRRV
jgi:hypothetical protein